MDTLREVRRQLRTTLLDQRHKVRRGRRKGNRQLPSRNHNVDFRTVQYVRPQLDANLPFATQQPRRDK